jgi:hypothetical protein
MRQSPIFSIVVALVGLSVLLMSVESVQGQDPEASRDPAVFKAQLRQAVVLGRKTLRDIQALPVDDSVPVDPKVHHNARQTYVLIRAARWGMELASQRATYKDPVFDLAYKRVEQAWHLSRTPVDYTGVGRAEYIGISTRDLSRAIRLVDQALVMLP